MDNKNYYRSGPLVSRDGRSEQIEPGAWKDINRWECASCETSYGSSRQYTYAYKWRKNDGRVSEKVRLCGYCSVNDTTWAKIAHQSNSDGEYLRYKKWMKQFNAPKISND